MPELKTIDAMPAAPDAARFSVVSIDLLNGERAVSIRPSRTQSLSPWKGRVLASGRQLWPHVRTAVAQEVDHGRLFLASPLLFGGGAVAWFQFDADPSLFRLAAWAVVLAIAILAAGYARPLVRKAALAGLLVVAGMVSAQLETWRAGTIMLDSPVTTTVNGRVERREGDGEGRWRYVVAVVATQEPEIRRAPERVTIVARGAKAPFEIGQWISGRARLVSPSGPALPGLDDFAFSTYFDGIGANGFFYGAPTAIPSRDSVAPIVRQGVIEGLYRLRSDIGDRIRSILPGDTGAFAASLVTDERRAISRETTDALRQSGLAHIVAISGLNMALSAGIFFVGLRKLLSLFPALAQAYPTKKIAAAFALFGLTAYYMISGFAVSAERAYIMMAIMLTAVLFDRPSISLRNIALSALVIIALSPSEALGPSFQMSFAATLALVAGYGLWIGRPMRDHPFLQVPAMKPVVVIGGFFGGIVLTSMIGGFSTALFSIEHFHRMSGYGLPANLMAMPIISFVVMPMGMLAMILTPLGLDVLPWKVAGLGLDVVIEIARMVSSWGGNVDIGRLPVWYFPVAVLGFLLMLLLHTRLRHLGTLIFGLATLAVLVISSAPPPDVVIAEDGSLVAILRDDHLASNRARPPDFIFGQWQRALAAEIHDPPEALKSDYRPKPRTSGRPGERHKLDFTERRDATKAMRASLASASENRFFCLKGAWCSAILDNGYRITALEDAAYLGPACDTSDIVITPVRLRFGECRSGALLFTGETLRRSGAIEIRIDEQGAPVVTKSYDRLDRLWLRHRAYDWRSGQFSGETSPVSDSDG
ncbi:ComEC/Rec2 family competence protein [Rhizobium sp. S152]|uniref:ComEC/Rec2 family competence protein n=1 Tax=Rhizobium sp. S152 TaxID=3055038 RepID=UPI0025A94DBD|nr:ComEC/Rec2 family competence protein [Rhizobium sp. S152]MDM9629719.1 ComEC/Rec2 family competence protein [Rhizobium sp. S152]